MLDDVPGFISRLLILPLDASAAELDEALRPCLEADSQLRILFAQHRDDHRLSNMYIGMLNVFQLPTHLQSVRARPQEVPSVRIPSTERFFPSEYLLPLGTTEGLRKSTGEPYMVSDLDKFRDNFRAFTQGVLDRMDWNNVAVAGGAVLACLTPVPQNRYPGKYFHESSTLRTSDVDLFLFGLNEVQARKKLLSIYQSIKEVLLFKSLCIRKENTITIISQYPHRHVQIILRLYHSPAEILAGFDVDAACVLYDGSNVMASPRAVMAMMRQCNTIDLSRRSPSYEYRLLKYRYRGYEVRYPALRREDVRPSIYSPELPSLPKGLARLLAFEVGTQYLNFNVPRERYLDGKGKHKPMDKAVSVEALGARSWYDSNIIRIPYGPKWNATSITKRLESMQNRVNFLTRFDEEGNGTILEELIGHHHCIFYGTMKECLMDICPGCPAAAADSPYAYGMNQGVQGPLRFITTNPGQQLMTGSFHPVDLDEWEEEAYIFRERSLPFFYSTHWPY